MEIILANTLQTSAKRVYSQFAECSLVLCKYFANINKNIEVHKLVVH